MMGKGKNQLPKRFAPGPVILPAGHGLFDVRQAGGKWLHGVPTNLLAAAPAMYEALKAVQPYMKGCAAISGGPRPRVLLEKVDAALASVTPPAGKDEA